MKKVILLILLLSALMSTHIQSQEICRLGIKYEFSLSNNWGKGRPVITGIIPFTNAESSGLKLYDIIIAIDGVDTENLKPNEIMDLLNPSNKEGVILTVKNISSPSRDIMLKKECKASNAITEDQLATAFAMYSLETNSERDFVCPFKTTVITHAIDFSRFKTFAFFPIDEKNSKMETAINSYIEKALTQKGLTVDVNKPDLMVQTFYYFDKNPNYKGISKNALKDTAYRYDSEKEAMVLLPFWNAGTAESNAEYLLQFGFRLIDQRDIQGRILWECEANELLGAPYRVDEYARIHVPLMCMQYPYVKYTRNVKYLVTQKKYNYTGLGFDIDHMNVIANIDISSPAYEAGLRVGSIIEKINGQKVKYSAEAFTVAYKNFISGTMPLRDAKTIFTDANGFSRCMFWDTFNYPKIVEAFQNPRNLTAFSYLYYYAPYINSSGNNICIFTLKNGKENIDLNIHPAVRQSTTVEIK